MLVCNVLLLFFICHACAWIHCSNGTMLKKIAPHGSPSGWFCLLRAFDWYQLVLRQLAAVPLVEGRLAQHPTTEMANKSIRVLRTVIIPTDLLFTSPLHSPRPSDNREGGSEEGEEGKKESWESYIHTLRKLLCKRQVEMSWKKCGLKSLTSATPVMSQRLTALPWCTWYAGED